MKRTGPDQYSNPRNGPGKWERAYRYGLNWRIWQRSKLNLKHVVKIAHSSFTLPIRAPQYPPLCFIATAVQPPSPRDRLKILYNSNYY